MKAQYAKYVPAVIPPFLVVLALIIAAPATAEEHQHGDGDLLGSVQFATSCNDPAQRDFDHAVALLHSFQFSRAVTGFNALLQDDPSCAIAYWGISLSAWGNPFAPGKKDQGQLNAGRQSAEQGLRLGAKTEREGAYLAAVGRLYQDFETTAQAARVLAYRDAMANFAQSYPQDNEAQIFYALALAVAEDPSDKTYADRLRAGAILMLLATDDPIGALAQFEITLTKEPRRFWSLYEAAQAAQLSGNGSYDLGYGSSGHADD
jgi:hypothetical protein